MTAASADERERSPERCRRSFPTPLPNADDCDRREQHEVDDPDELDRLSHFAFLLGALILLPPSECDNAAPSPAVSLSVGRGRPGVDRGEREDDQAVENLAHRL